MATVGQIVYNIQDYQHSGGYISTSNTDVTKTISSSNNPGYDQAKIDIFNTNVVQKYSSKQFSKLGINAPPGTRFILNGTKTFLVGRSGIYELDADIVITSLKFERPMKYQLDAVATNIALTNGINNLKAAENKRQTDIQNLDTKKQNTGMSDKDYWIEYSKIQADYDKAYQPAFVEFNTGLNGIYKLPNPNDLSASENYEDLYNVIIDFLY